MRKGVALMVLPLLLSLLLGCGREAVPIHRTEPVQSGGRLTCPAETEEEARQIAELYGIELLDFRYGLALFLTEEDPAAVMERGREHGWPELSRDHTASIS